MISSTAEYALRAVAHLATHSAEPSTVQHMAEATKSPAGYLAKIMQDLVRAGIVHSQRGPNGGFMLARDARQLSVLDVINAVDPIRRIEACPLGIPAHGHTLCPLHQRLDNAIALVESVFADTTIADLLQPPRGTEERCVFPRVELRRSARSRKAKRA